MGKSTPFLTLNTAEGIILIFTWVEVIKLMISKLQHGIFLGIVDFISEWIWQKIYEI